MHRQPLISQRGWKRLDRRRVGDSIADANGPTNFPIVRRRLFDGGTRVINESSIETMDRGPMRASPVAMKNRGNRILSRE